MRDSQGANTELFSMQDDQMLEDQALEGLLSAGEYAVRIKEIRRAYRLIPTDAVMDPGPGALASLEAFLERTKRAIGTGGVAFLEVREDVDNVVRAFVDPRKALTEGRSSALAMATTEFISSCLQMCRLCGDEIIEVAGFFSKGSGVCERHRKFRSNKIRFLEDAQAYLEQQRAEEELGRLSDLSDKQEDDAVSEDAGEEVVEPPRKGSDPRYLKLYEPTQVASLEQFGKTRNDRDAKARIDAIAKALKKRDEFRLLQPLPKDWMVRLDSLEEGFPNFSVFIDFLRGQFSLSANGTGAVCFSPVILNGQPGIGKSEILARLSTTFEMPAPLYIDFSTANTASRLSGSEMHWANCQEGELFNKLVTGEIGNPIVYIDEIEKSENEGRYNPTSALYGLLEKTAAKHFQDLSLREFPIDAGEVLWVAAANQAEKLEPPLRSRFTILEISPPNSPQRRRICASIFLQMIVTEPWGHLFAPLPEATLDVLESLSPRQAKLLMRTGAGKACYEGRREVLPRDVQPFLPKRRSGPNFLSAAA